MLIRRRRKQISKDEGKHILVAVDRGKIHDRKHTPMMLMIPVPHPNAIHAPMPIHPI